MKSAFAAFFALVLFLSFSAPAGADFELVRKIPAPSMGCDSGYPLIKAMGSDYTYLVLVRGCYIDSLATVYRIDPDDGGIVNYDFWDYTIPECPGFTMPISMAYCPYDARYYVGTGCGAIVGLVWQTTDSAYVFSSYLIDELTRPSGMAPGQYSNLFASDHADTNLVQFEATGVFIDETPMGGVANPVGMATYNENLFVLDEDNYFIVEMTIDAVPVDTHYVEDWSEYVQQDAFIPMAATFMGDNLYLAGNGDSIHVYEMVEGEETYTEPVPEGEDVLVEIIPEELALTFDSVTDSGDVNVEVAEDDTCNAPDGVQLFAEYYHIGTDATFEFITEVAIMDSVYPEGVDQDKVRVFSRPSDSCGTWRDITTAPVEVIETLKVLRRSRSEDDEFSVFCLGEDNRTPQEVVEFKIADLRGHIQSAEDSIPEPEYSDLLEIMEAGEEEYYSGETGNAAEEIDGIEDTVRDEPLIPHTYDPMAPGTNVAGRIISRAHSLGFSLNYSADTRYYSAAEVVPEIIHPGLRFEWLRAFIEVPVELDPSEVDVDHVYLEGELKAQPDSVKVFDYDSDGRDEIRALFTGYRASQVLQGTGCTDLANTTCFVSGYELHSVATIDVTPPVVQVMSDSAVLSGTTVLITWDRLECDQSSTFELSYSLNAGDTWELIDSGVVPLQYDWLVPDVVTDAGLIRVTCDGAGGEPIDMYSGILTIETAAGIDVETAVEFRLALRPNPSQSAVEIEFASPKGERAVVSVYSVRGELVKTLFRGRMAEGANHVVWSGDNSGGEPVSAGTYFVVLRAESGTAAEKLILQR